MPMNLQVDAISICSLRAENLSDPENNLFSPGAALGFESFSRESLQSPTGLPDFLLAGPQLDIRNISEKLLYGLSLEELMSGYREKLPHRTPERHSGGLLSFRTWQKWRS